MKILITNVFFPLFFISDLFSDVFLLKNLVNRFQEHKKYRGMSLNHDCRDWLDRYPYDHAAKPKEIISFYKNLGFRLFSYQQTGHGFGNNQFLFQKDVE